jgi:hypothetical protein
LKLGSTTAKILGPKGPGQFVLRRPISGGATAMIIRKGNIFNRVFDSRFMARGDGFSGPIGSSFSPVE